MHFEAIVLVTFVASKKQGVPFNSIRFSWQFEPTAEIFLFHLYFLSNALVQGVGKSDGDGEAVIFAYATDRCCGSFLTKVVL